MTIQLINQNDGVIAGMGRFASLLYKGIMIILTEARQPFHPKSEAMEFDYYGNNHVMAQASKSLNFFTGEKQVLYLEPEGDEQNYGHCSLTLISRLRFLEDEEHDDGDAVCLI